MAPTLPPGAACPLAGIGGPSRAGDRHGLPLPCSTHVITAWPRPIRSSGGRIATRSFPFPAGPGALGWLDPQCCWGWLGGTSAGRSAILRPRGGNHRRVDCFDLSGGHRQQPAQPRSPHPAAEAGDRLGGGAQWPAFLGPPSLDRLAAPLRPREVWSLFQAGSAQGLSPRSAPMRWAQAKPLKATALRPWPGKQESPTQ